MEWTFDGTNVNYDLSGVDGTNAHIKSKYFPNGKTTWLYPDFLDPNFKNSPILCLNNNGVKTLPLPQTSSSSGQLYAYTYPSRKYYEKIKALPPGAFDCNNTPKEPIDPRSPTASSLMKNSSCLSTCAANIGNTINQHYCRKWIYDNEIGPNAPPNTYCKWLQKEVTGVNGKKYPMSNAYCWQFNEFSCLDENCGWNNMSDVESCKTVMGGKDSPPTWNTCSCLKYPAVCETCRCYGGGNGTACTSIGTCYCPSPSLPCGDGRQPPAPPPGTNCPPIPNGYSSTFGCIKNPLNPLIALPQYPPSSTIAGPLVFEINYVLPALRVSVIINYNLFLIIYSRHMLYSLEYVDSFGIYCSIYSIGFGYLFSAYITKFKMKK